MVECRGEAATPRLFGRTARCRRDEPSATARRRRSPAYREIGNRNMIDDNNKNDSNRITNAGESAEGRFRAITGARKAARKTDGDALLGDHAVEIKTACGTINQIRAHRF